MKKIILLLIVLISHVSFAQQVELFGIVDFFKLEETGKIYYTKDGEKFSHKKFVTYDKNRKYTFTMSKKEIQKNKIEVLVFAADTTQQTTQKYACVQRVNIGAIVNSPDFKNLKTIRLNNDLLLDENCVETIYWDAKMEGMERFVGSYGLSIQDTSRLIQLENFLMRYKSALAPMTKDYMNEEEGSWNFNNLENKLTLYIHQQFNKTYGLVLRKRLEYHFIVSETFDGLKFQSKNGTLTKN